MINNAKQLNVFLLEENARFATKFITFLHKYDVNAFWLDSSVELREKFEWPDSGIIVLGQHMKKNSLDEILTRLRRRSSIGLFVASQYREIADVLIAFENGADGYFFHDDEPREVLAHFRSVARRIALIKRSEASPPYRDLMGWRIDLLMKGVYAPDGRRINLTQSEFNVFYGLFREPGRTLSRSDLANVVFSRSASPNFRGIDVSVCHIRTGLKAYFGEKEIIRSIRGGGYMWVAGKLPNCKVIS